MWCIALLSAVVNTLLADILLNASPPRYFPARLTSCFVSPASPKNSAPSRRGESKDLFCPLGAAPWRLGAHSPALSALITPWLLEAHSPILATLITHISHTSVARLLCPPHTYLEHPSGWILLPPWNPLFLSSAYPLACQILLLLPCLLLPLFFPPAPPVFCKYPCPAFLRMGCPTALMCSTVMCTM